MFPRLRVIFSLLFLLFSLFYALQFLLHKSSFCSSSPSSFKAKPVHILIVSSWRSGSSFIGQIFNHNKEVFYLFEPGHAVWMKVRQESSELLHYPVRDLLQSLFICDVSPLHHYLPKGGKHINELPFFAESRALCTPPACSAYIPAEGYDRQKCFYRCVNSSMDTMAEVCQMYTHVVMKTVRILDLSILLPLLQNPNLNLRIIHLVRDPRAVALSRKSFPLEIEDNILLKNEVISKDKNEGIPKDKEKVNFKEKKKGIKDMILQISNVMAKICKAQVTINKFSRMSKILNGRYMVIRHEDLARYPIESLRQIYNFSELQLTEGMEQWMYNITHEEIKDVEQFMTFSRESSKVIGKWRLEADFNLVNPVQLMCKEAMRLFGYLPVRSKEEQGNMNIEIMKDKWSQTEDSPTQDGNKEINKLKN